MPKLKSPKAKGNLGETACINKTVEQLGREKCPQDRRNDQATAWGGIATPDISIKGLEAWHIEVKNTQTYQFPAWSSKIEGDCPRGKVPVIAYRVQGRNDFFWLQFPLDHLEKFCLEAVTAMGYQVYKDDEGDAA